MLGIILSILVVLIGIFIIVYFIFGGCMYPGEFICFSMISVLITFFLSLFVIIPLGGGIGKNYGEVEQVGYLINCSHEGLIWKTYEGTIQKGVGEQASLENAFKFSTTDKDIASKLYSLLSSNQRIRVKCKLWFIMPYYKGLSGKELLSIEIIEKEEVKE
jgi:hypothetical protein